MFDDGVDITAAFTPTESNTATIPLFTYLGARVAVSKIVIENRGISDDDDDTTKKE